MSIYRYPARCLKKGSKLIGTLQYFEKKGVNLYSIRSLRDVEVRGVNLWVPCEMLKKRV